MATLSLSPNPGSHRPSRRRPRRRQSTVLAAAPWTDFLPDVLDAVVDNFVDPAGQLPGIDPRRVLAGNWAPVNELPPTPCPAVNGRLPAVLLGGAYLRNGPNPNHLPRGPHHLFEGDGMVHALLFPDHHGQTPTLASRFVQTNRYLSEKEAGKSLLPKLLSGFRGPGGLLRAAAVAARALTGRVDLSAGARFANTSVVRVGGRLLAADESDLPYAVLLSPSGDVSTLGRWDCEGTLAGRMTAHPKTDPVTGEVFAFRYDVLPPHLVFFRFDADGTKRADVPVRSLRRPSFLHDFAITERHAVFCDTQLVIRPVETALLGAPLVKADDGKVCRVGVIPRYASSDDGMRWFDVPGFNPLHTVNAWDEDGGAVLVATNTLGVENVLGRMELLRGSAERLRLDLRTGHVSRIPLSSMNLEFGAINQRFQGRRSRFGYFGVGSPPPKLGGVVKLDLTEEEGVVAERTYGEGRYGGEPCFVPAPDEGDAEDDGYLVAFVHDECTRKSSLEVMDARSLEVVADVALPGRVPYGLHGLFVAAAELRQQRG